jgi:acyl homoserine lactone synthase
MLKDVFPHLLGDHAAPERPDIWEISRFAIDPELRQCQSLGAISRIVGVMLIELFDFAERNDIRRVVAASDIRFDRILSRAGLRTRHYAPPVRMDNSLAVAGWADITEDNRLAIEARLVEPAAAMAPQPDALSVKRPAGPLKEMSFG